MANVIVSEEKQKPVYDEQTLAKLLEAAYVLQEHSQELRALEAHLGLTRSELKDSQGNPLADPDSAQGRMNAADSAQHSLAEAATRSASNQGFNRERTLDEIAELQRLIEVRGLGLDDALALIAEQLIEMCGAAGAAIGLSSNEEISYPAVAGIGALPLRSSVTRERACCFPCLRTGQVFRCADVKAEVLIDAEACTRRGIASFIAAPVFGEKGVAGGIELYFCDPNAFGEQDVQTCQLMAGIVTEVLSRDSMPLDATSEMSALLEQLSKLQAGKPLDSVSVVRCYKCGHELVGEEQFCGQCGAARSEQGEPVSMQSKVASLWNMKQATPAVTKEVVTSGGAADSSSLAAEVPINLHALQQSMAAPGDTAPEPASQISPSPQSQQEAPELSADIDSIPSGDWSSAVSAKEYLEQVAESAPRGWLGTFWNEHRGDLYLAVAIVLVIAVLWWGVGSTRPVTATNTSASAATTRHKAAAPELSLFDRILIQLGLAEPPAVPEDKGNPAAAVWVDLQTGLYYCAGADLYGKTPRGKYTAQRDAQLDQFAPAYRKVCD